MASPAYSFLEAGTPITWASSGGSKVITCTSLAGTGTTAAARQGDKSATLVDGTKGLPELLEVMLTMKFTSAPTAGGFVALYFGESDSSTAGTGNPGTLTGADGSLSNPSEIVAMCNLVGNLIASNAIGTGTQQQRFIYAPTCAYIIPVIYNQASPAFSSTALDTLLTVTPYYRKIPY